MQPALRHITRWTDQILAPMDRHDLIPHPLKALSRRFLGIGLGLAILLHATGIGGVMLYRIINAEKTVPVRLAPYPLRLIAMIDPAALVTSEKGGGDGNRQATAPSEPGAPVRLNVEVGIPEPVLDAALIDPSVTLASQEEMQEYLAPVDKVAAPTDDRGTGAAGQDSGGGSGIGGIGGDGPPGAWRYDTPPNPRRLITAVQSEHLSDVEGTVRFRLLIDERGQVADARIVASSGYTALDALALDAIFASSFNPAMWQGHAVKAWITFGYGFRISK